MRRRFSNMRRQFSNMRRRFPPPQTAPSTHSLHFLRRLPVKNRATRTESNRSRHDSLLNRTRHDGLLNRSKNDAFYDINWKKFLPLKINSFQFLSLILIPLIANISQSSCFRTFVELLESLQHFLRKKFMPQNT